MNWLAELIKMLMDVLSPELRDIICSSLRRWEEIAAQTANPWDDVLVKLLLGLFDCPNA